MSTLCSYPESVGPCTEELQLDLSTIMNCICIQVV